MIKCADIRCKYRNDKTGSCKCKNLNLSAWKVHTTNMGYKDFLECKSFEESDNYKEMRHKLKEILGDE